MPIGSLPQGLFLPPRTTTLYVAAADATDRSRAQADFLCTGVNDHLVIQAALDALPAGGGEVHLSEGTFNIEASLVLDSNQTLRGCGRNTILTTTTADLDIITATGTEGSEKTGILLANFCIDGDAGSVTNDCGIKWTYVDYSGIRNISSIDNGEDGIKLITSDHNEITGNTCTGNLYGIYLDTSEFNIVSYNTCSTNGDNGIYLDASDHNNISSNNSQGDVWQGIYAWDADDNVFVGNVCQGSGKEGFSLNGDNNVISGNSITDNGLIGLDISGDNNIISSNVVRGNAYHGIDISGVGNDIISNTCFENSQDSDNSYDDIRLYAADYNLIQGNLCRAGGETNKPRYGINISNANCDNNKVIDNDLYDDGFGTAPYNDAGTLTHVEDNNRGITIDQIKMFRFMKNTSGAQRVAGDVVSLKAVAAGNEVTAPAAIGERQVYGMVAETIDDNNWGLVQVKGKTTVLKSTNAGGGNIVIGDFLITENGVRARKAAAATDPIFARALGACAAADCTIDAYIVSPWD